MPLWNQRQGRVGKVGVPASSHTEIQIGKGERNAAGLWARSGGSQQ